METIVNTRVNNPGYSKNCNYDSIDLILEMGNPQAYRPKFRYCKEHGQASTT